MQFGKCFALTCAAAALLAAQAPSPVADPVVAVIDGKNITKSDVEHILSVAPPDFQNFYKNSPAQALSTWFVVHHLGELAQQRGVDQRSPLKEQLEFLLHNMLAQAMVTEEENTFPVATEAIEEYYRAHPDLYEETNFRAVVIRFQPTATGTSTEDLQAIAQGLLEKSRPEADALKIAQEVAKQARAGVDFAKLVEQYSEDPDSKAKGGEMPGVRAESTLPPDFRKAILALEKGKISDPLRQPNAFYIIRIDERGLRPIDDLRGDIIMNIRREHRNSWLTQINSRYTPEIKDPEFFAPKAPGFDFGAIQGLPKQ